MSSRHALWATGDLTMDETRPITAERFELRLAEECGQLRLDMVTEFGKVRTEIASEGGKLRTEMAAQHGALRAEMAAGFGSLRAEMADRNVSLLKWLLAFFVAQVASMASLLALFQ